MQRKWPYIKSLIRVNTTRTYKCSCVSNTDDVESRYFVSSIITDGLDKSFADTIQDIILARWQIESRHWVIDDVPDNLEVNGFENTISADTPLGSFAITRKKIKGKR